MGLFEKLKKARADEGTPQETEAESDKAEPGNGDSKEEKEKRPDKTDEGAK